MKNKTDKEKKAIADQFFISELGCSPQPTIEPPTPEEKDTPGETETPKTTPTLTLEQIDKEIAEIRKKSEVDLATRDEAEAQQLIDRHFYLDELKKELEGKE